MIKGLGCIQVLAINIRDDPSNLHDCSNTCTWVLTLELSGRGFFAVRLNDLLDGNSPTVTSD
jgi:hypothetical protein